MPTTRIWDDVIAARQEQVVSGTRLAHNHIQYRDTLIYVVANLIREIEELDAIADKRESEHE